MKRHCFYPTKILNGIYTPPDWIGMIPYAGSVIEYFYGFFSLHGFIGLFVFSILITVGMKIQGTHES